MQNNTDNDTIKSLQDIILDEEFKRLLPPLDEQTFLSLEQSILDYGCMNPLVLWGNILIDGYNRYQILEKHNLPFNTTALDFDSRDEVLIWIIATQVSRRNLTPMQLTFFRGLHYNTDKKLHGGIDRFTQNAPSRQNVNLDGRTANRLSKHYGVTGRTIIRDGEIADVISMIGRASPDAKRDILSGTARISRRQLREMSSGSEDDIAATALEIASGIFAERDRLGKPDFPGAGGSTDKSGNDSGDGDLLPQTAIVNRANEFIENIRQLPPNSDPAELKEVIRSYIKSLEELYGQIDSGLTNISLQTL